MRSMRVGIWIKRSLLLVTAILFTFSIASVVLADSHEVRYTPSNEVYGECRARHPYTHIEDCNRDYDFLMQHWLTKTDTASVTATFQSCQSVPESLIVIDTQGRPAVPRHLVPTAPDGDDDGFACGGQLKLERKSVALETPAPDSPRVVETESRKIRFTPTNETYGQCRARYPYSHFEDCNQDYDFLMRFWLANMAPITVAQSFQTCREVPEMLIVIDTQGRRAVPRALVPSASDGDDDGFACGGQLEVVPTPTPALKLNPEPTGGATAPSPAPTRKPTISLDEIDSNCFDPWNGHHRTQVVNNKIQDSLGDIVKRLLNDPDSMEIREV